MLLAAEQGIQVFMYKCTALLATITSATQGTCSVVAAYTLRVKTCNDTNAGTKDIVHMSFCQEEPGCEASPNNENYYNQRGELAEDGAWNSLLVPLDYEPSTMVIAIDGDDAWCIEHVYWEDGKDLLGNGARIYLDCDRGMLGCEFGVHASTGPLYPCQSSWRFFNLQGSDEYSYEVGVKTCHRAESATVRVSICSESTCDEQVGDVIRQDMSTRKNTNGWAYQEILAPFNPAAMSVTGLGDKWCAHDITLNGYSLTGSDSSPVRLLGKGEERRFQNVQFYGAVSSPSRERCQGCDFGSFIWRVGIEIVITVIAGFVFTVTMAGTAQVYRRIIPNRRKGNRLDKSDRPGNGTSDQRRIFLRRRPSEYSEDPWDNGTGFARGFELAPIRTRSCEAPLNYPRLVGSSSVHLETSQPAFRPPRSPILTMGKIITGSVGEHLEDDDASMWPNGMTA